MWALFAVWSCERCEATVEECLSIEEKWSCKVNEFYSRKLAAHHDPQSGYQTTWSDFINAGQGTNQCLPIGGPATVNVDCGPLVNELWPFVMPLINDCICHMKPILQWLGEDKNELSPFLRESDSPADLATAYENYISHVSSRESVMSKKTTLMKWILICPIITLMIVIPSISKIL